MSQTVFILGAGASSKAGAPLMKNFLDVAEKLLNSNSVSESTDKFKLVFKALAALQSTHSKATLDVMNIESVFAAFEMAKLLGRLGDLSEDEIQKLPEAMRTVIVRTLERTIQFPMKHGFPGAPEPYLEFVKFIKANIVKTSSRWSGASTKFSIITFNYDLCIDLAFHSVKMPLKYCLDDAKNDQAISLLKLHGSLNWGHCSKCNELVAWPLEKYISSRLWLNSENDYVHLDLSGEMSQFAHCQNSMMKGPYLVPPTWNKSQYHNSLEVVWKAAARELSSAENIIISGYSMPDSDQFFRYLYALGTISDRRLKKIWLFDPSAEVEGRFRNLLGQATLPRFTFFQRAFEAIFDQLNLL